MERGWLQRQHCDRKSIKVERQRGRLSPAALVHCAAVALVARTPLTYIVLLGSSRAGVNDVPILVKSVTSSADWLTVDVQEVAPSEKNIAGVEAICCKVEQASIRGESVEQLDVALVAAP